MFPHVVWLQVYQEICFGQSFTPSSQPFAAFVRQSGAAALAFSRHVQWRLAHATHSGRGASEVVPLVPLVPLVPEPLVPLVPLVPPVLEAPEVPEEPPLDAAWPELELTGVPTVGLSPLDVEPPLEEPPSPELSPLEDPGRGPHATTTLEITKKPKEFA